jgi:hypothetical protein
VNGDGGILLNKTNILRFLIIIQCDGEILLLKATFNIIEVIFSNKRPSRPIEGSLVN